jgi:nicotinamidase-related amidase
MAALQVAAVPGPFRLEPPRTALLVIDMQRDFVLPGGFGEALGNDVSLLWAAVEPLRLVLAAAREAGLLVVHTREGHRPDLSDCPPAKRSRGRPSQRIGDAGPMGRILVRGEYGHGIIDELAPMPGEPVIDKPGKGSFHATGLEALLVEHGITSLVVTGVTTEVCVHTTVREANDRGLECLVLADCVASYRPDLHAAALEMTTAQGGIFGWVGTSADLLDVLSPSQIDHDGGDPEVGEHLDRSAAVAKVFADYEHALIAGDVVGLTEFFWPGPEVVRFGVSDEQWGAEELLAWRIAHPTVPPGRTLSATRITTFGADTAVVITLFSYPGRSATGRQSQTWRLMEGRWRIVHAHVSER